MSPTRGTTRIRRGGGAAFGVGEDEFHGGDGQALRDAGSLVDFLVFAGAEGDLLDNLADEMGDFDSGLPDLACFAARDQASWVVMRMPSSMLSG